MKGWLGIAAYVAIYDSWAAIYKQPTLSNSFMTTSRSNPVVVGAVTIYLVTHLYGYWPRRADPLVGYVVLGGKLTEKIKHGKEKV